MNWKNEIIQRMKNLKGTNRRIIYLDECIFTTKTMKTTDYTSLKSPHRIPQADINQPVYALILAISIENGLEHYQIFEKSVNYQKFIEYLDELYIENKHSSIAIFADNLSVHKTPNVMMKLHELDIEIIYNVPNQPDFNPVESCFSKIKNYYRRQKLNKLVNNEIVDHK